jgi:hypothetical protein
VKTNAQHAARLRELAAWVPSHLAPDLIEAAEALERPPLSADRISVILERCRLQWPSSPPTREFAPQFAEAIQRELGVAP